jgi:hypothetical protein
MRILRWLNRVKAVLACPPGECDDSSAQVMQRNRLPAFRRRVGYGETHAIRQ